MGIEHEAIHLETSSVLFRETPIHLMQVPCQLESFDGDDVGRVVFSKTWSSRILRFCFVFLTGTCRMAQVKEPRNVNCNVKYLRHET